MVESLNYTERRQYERASVQNIVLGILNSGENGTIGTIADISFGGVKIIHNDLRMAPEDIAPHSIDLIADDQFIFDIPCSSVWEINVEKEPRSKITTLKQCGIQFGKLTLNQANLLRRFINRCVQPGLNGNLSNVRATNI